MDIAAELLLPLVAPLLLPLLEVVEVPFEPEPELDEPFEPDVPLEPVVEVDEPLGAVESEVEVVEPGEEETGAVFPLKKLLLMQDCEHALNVSMGVLLSQVDLIQSIVALA